MVLSILQLPLLMPPPLLLTLVLLPVLPAEGAPLPAEVALPAAATGIETVEVVEEAMMTEDKKEPSRVILPPPDTEPEAAASVAKAEGIEKTKDIAATTADGVAAVSAEEKAAALTVEDVAAAPAPVKKDVVAVPTALVEEECVAPVKEEVVTLVKEEVVAPAEEKVAAPVEEEVRVQSRKKY